MAQPPIAIAGYQVSFPYKPYGTQLGFMNQFLRAVDQQGNALLEAPTGSGKTACLLASALAWQKRHIEAAAAVKTRNVTRMVARARQGRSAAGAAAGGACGDAAAAVTEGGEDEQQPTTSPKGGGGGDGTDPLATPSSDAAPGGRSEEVDEPGGTDEDEEVPKVPKIYYATRTHSQIAQVCGSCALCLC